MSLTKEQILSEAMSLDPAAREDIAEELLLSVNRIADPEWIAEIRRRIGSMDRGEGSSSPVDEVVERLRRKRSA